MPLSDMIILPAYSTVMEKLPPIDEKIYITVGISTWQRGIILYNSLKSILRQKFPPQLYEVIVIDDASWTDIDKDYAERIIEEHPKHNIRYYKRLWSSTKNEHAPINIMTNLAMGDIFIKNQADNMWLRGDYLMAALIHHGFNNQMWMMGLHTGIHGSGKQHRLNSMVKENNWEAIEHMDVDPWHEEFYPHEFGASILIDNLKSIRGYDETRMGYAPDDWRLYQVFAVLKRGLFTLDRSLVSCHQDYTSSGLERYAIEGHPKSWHNMDWPWGQMENEDIAVCRMTEPMREVLGGN